MSPGGGVIDRSPRWLRWILVLPSAAASYVVIQVAVALLHTVAGYFGDLPFVPAIMGDYFPQFVNSMAGPYAFVWTGTRLAPAHKFVSAVILAIGVSAVSGGILLLALANPDVTARQPGGLTWIVVTALLGVGTAIKAALDRRQSEKN